MNWTIKPFAELTNEELYALLRLRSEIFIIEQTCAYQDLDNKDQACHHVMAWDNGQLVACTRLVPPGVSYIEPSIGRVATSKSVRGKGMGREVMKRSIEAIQQLYGNVPIRISAQAYLIRFYNELGFKEVGEVYLEDDIEHIEMIS